MSKEEHWQPGDLALCVRGGIVTRTGSVYVVREVLLPDTFRRSEIDGALYQSMGQSLLFEGIPYNGNSGAVERFRKIHPHTPDEEDEETIRLLKGETVHTMENDTGWRPVGFPAVGVEWFFDEDGRRSSDDDIGGWIDEQPSNC